MSQSTRKGAAHWQRGKNYSMGVVEFEKNPATGRPWRRTGHLQRTGPETNLEVVGPVMRTEHGTDVERFPFVEICSGLLCKTRTVV